MHDMTQVHPRINIRLQYIRNTSEINSEVTYTSTMKTYLEARPTTNMKKGWFCRTSYDKNNSKISLVSRGSRSSDDDDLASMMIQ